VVASHPKWPRWGGQAPYIKKLKTKYYYIIFILKTVNNILLWEKYYLAPLTTSDLLFSSLKYQKLLNGSPNYQTIVF
jgi:hypothetical protein